MTHQPLPEVIAAALRDAHKSLQQTSAEIRRAYADAEESGDYSDADEKAADNREHLHREYESLLGFFAEQYPGLFGPSEAEIMAAIDTLGKTSRYSVKDNELEDWIA